MTKEDRILDAAAAVLSKNPSASVDEIAAEAGVGRATVFRLFEGRPGLLRALAWRAIEQGDRAAADAMTEARGATDALRRVVQACVALGDTFHFLATTPVVERDPELHQAYQRQMHEMASLVDEAKQEGGLRNDMPTSWIVASIDGQIWSAALAVGRGEVGREQAEALVWDTIARGMGAASDGIGTDG
ncbi:MAG: helix-turn-helix domain-containing protein [Gemmatimonadota bacterium]